MADQANDVPQGWTIVDEPRMAVSHEQAPTTDAGLMMAAAGKAVPLTANLAVEAATNPNVPRAMSTVGQVVGGVEGLRKAGPLGAAGGVYAGGKAGWFTGKLLQRVGAPVATAMDKLAPYAQSLSTLGAAAGVGDLAQIAEPKRKDIGFLGIGRTDPNMPASSGGATFGGPGTLTWRQQAQAVRDAIMRRLAGQP